MSFEQHLRTDWEKEHDPFTRQIEANNREFRDVILPAYQRIRTLFAEKYWLIDVDTREYFRDFLAFVDCSERWLAGSLPREVLERVPNDEERVIPF